MTARILQFPVKPRPVDAIEAVESLDNFGYDLPCDTEPRENNLRADGTLIVPCQLPVKGDKA